MVSAGATFVVSGTNGAICEPVPQPASAAVMRSSEAWRRRPPSPPRVLWVRRPRHAVDLALRDRPEIMLVLNVRPGIRIVLLDPVQKELLAGATQVHPPDQAVQSVCPAEHSGQALFPADPAAPDQRRDGDAVPTEPGVVTEDACATLRCSS